MAWLKRFIPGLAVVAVAVGILWAPVLLGQGEFEEAKSPAASRFKLTGPAASLTRGEKTTIEVSIKRDKDFDEDVALEFSNIPEGVTIEPASPVIKKGDQKVSLTLDAAKDSAVGDFTIGVSGKPGTGAGAKGEIKLTLVSTQLPWYQTLVYSVGFKWVAVLATVGISYWLGLLFARAIRMPEYGWRVGIILASLAVCPVVIWARWPPNMGVDLNGGMILIYQIDQEASLSISSPTDEGPNAPQQTRRRGRRKAASAVGGTTTELAAQIMRRINPGGTLEIKVRPYGETQIEIIIPETDPEEVGRIKRLIEKAGVLEFLIVANGERDRALIELSATEPEKRQMFVKRNRGQADEAIVGRWVTVGREIKSKGGVKPLKVVVANRTIRDARTKERINVPSNVLQRRDEDGILFAQWLKEKGIDEVEVLMVHPTDENMQVTGSHLSSVQSSFDESSRPSVNFSMKIEGGARMARLTSANTPDPTTKDERYLGIVLDEQLLSAPSIQSVISDQGRITGNFSQDEVNELVGILRGGSLSAVLIKEPVSENPIGPELGKDTIRRGAWSSGISLACVLVFMMVYYRFSGVVAVWTLLINLWIMMALMVLLHATFTLAGIAGIVLTMGMALDSNVLIFERIREELERGAALRMALRNGFSRAMATIIDSHLTTLISGVALYVIGTDQIRGFAVTLILGILLSLYAAIFCARVVFDIGERKRWITKLTMYKLFEETKFNFMGWWRPATIASLAIIVAGIVGTYFRGQEILSIDFTGGTAVHLKFKEPMPVDQVRSRLTSAFAKASEQAGKTLEFNLVNVPVEGKKETYFKVDSSLEDVDELKRVIAEEFKEADGSLLAQNLVKFNPALFKTQAVVPRGEVSPGETPARKPTTSDFEETPPAKETPPAEKTPAKSSDAPSTPDKPDTESEKDKPDETQPEKTDGASLQSPADSLLALADDSTLIAAQDEEPKVPAEPEDKKPEDKKPEEEKADDKKPDVKKPDDKKPVEEEPAVTPPKTPVPSGGQRPTTPEVAESRFTTEGKLDFDEAIGHDNLREAIRASAEKLGITLLEPNILLTPADPAEGSGALTGVTRSKAWNVKLSADADQTKTILARLKSDMDSQIYWPSWNKIGGSIAGKMQRVATFALLASCMGMIAYIWYRFEKLMYGLAAVVAVVHDVFITLAALALSHWLSGVLGFAGIEDFKIGMIELAAFLTIIGYSINDKIVVFDRIREVRGKSPNINREMINLSINQTLARTLLTGFSVMIVLVILFFFGGQGLHGFSFVLWVGVVAGTYSSVFIATPLLLWMSRFSETARANTKAAA